jgi:type IV secretory pathway TrbL component
MSEQKMTTNSNTDKMKKQILSLALVATMVGAIVAGCSSSKTTSGSDSTSTDTSKMAPAATDTTKKDTSAKPDTTKKDTTKKPVH